MNVKAFMTAVPAAREAHAGGKGGAHRRQGRCKPVDGLRHSLAHQPGLPGLISLDIDPD